MTTATTTTTPPPAPPAPPAEATPPAPPAEDSAPQPEEEKDWKAEYEAQVRINKTLERKTKRDLAALEALRGKDTPPSADGDVAADAAAIRREIEKTVRAESNTRVLAAEVRAAAAGVLTDPADALLMLDMSSFEPGEDGTIDTEEIRDAIADLVKQKPYLAAQGGQRWQGEADAGARKGPRVTQLSRTDLAGMSPEQIVAAKAEGRLNDILGIRSTP